MKATGAKPKPKPMPKPKPSPAAAAAADKKALEVAKEYYKGVKPPKEEKAEEVFRDIDIILFLYEKIIQKILKVGHKLVFKNALFFF